MIHFVLQTSVKGNEMSKKSLPVNGGAMPSSSLQAGPNSSSKAHFGYNPSIKERRSFIGGSDARIIMGNDEAKLIRLWREKRGEGEPEDPSQDLIAYPGTINED